MRLIALFWGGLALALTGCDSKSSSGSRENPWCPAGERARRGRCVVLPSSITFDGEAMYQSGVSGFDGYRALAAVGSDLFAVGSVWSGASTATSSGVRALLTKPGDASWQSTLSASADWSQGVTLESDGTSLFVGGLVYGSIGNNLTPAGDADVFISKVNPASGAVQVAQVGSTAAEWVEGSALVAGDAIYIVGTTSGTMPGATSAGGHDAFVAKYSLATLTLAWVKQFGTEANDYGRRIAVDGSGHLFVSGITFKHEVATPPVSGGEDTLLWSLSPTDGSIVWTTRVQTTANDRPQGLLIDPSGNPILVGMTLGKMGSTTYGGADIFVTKFSASSGEKSWGPFQYGTKGNEIPETALLSADNSTLYVVGATDGSFAGEDSHVGGLDGFVASIALTDGRLGTVKQFGSLNRDVPYAATFLGTTLVVGGESEGNITQVNIDGLDSFWVKYATPF